MKLKIENIKTERLHIRKLESSDANSIYEIFSNPDVTRYWSSPQMTKLTEAEEFVRATHEGFGDNSLLEWGVMESGTEKLIGTCAFASWDKVHRRAEIGFALHQNWWGKGLMKELLSVFIPFGFDALKLHRIEGDVDPRNIPSIKLLEHYGFKKEGHMRERYLLNSEKQDAILYGLLKSDYEKRSL